MNKSPQRSFLGIVRAYDNMVFAEYRDLCSKLTLLTTSNTRDEIINLEVKIDLVSRESTWESISNSALVSVYD